MLPSPPLRCFRFILLLSICVLLGACATSFQGPGFSRGALRLDSDSVGRMRYASLQGTGRVASSSAVRAATSQIALLVPAVLALFPNHEAELDQLELALLDCVQRAEREINAERFENRSPTAADCKAVVGVDRCGRPIYQSMMLGNLKHAHALACMQDILRELWPAPFSIEQRYRFYPHAKLVETVSREEEQRLIDEDCTSELRGTIKPDVVLHSNYDLLRAMVILDLKFPCPVDNRPQWTIYGSTSVYSGFRQDMIYRDALGGTTLILSPEGIYP